MKKSNIVKTVALLSFVMLVGAGCVSAVDKNTNTTGSQVKSLKKAPAFSLQDYNGKTVSLSDFAGQPVIVNSWAVWCPFCLKELPDFVTVQKEFSGKITIIAIDRAESLNLAKEYTDDLKVTDDLVFLLDPNDSFYRSIGGFSMPETIFVNGDGEIEFQKRGQMSLAEMRQRINDLIN